MENNIVNFSEYKKKKANEEKFKDLDMPFEDGFFLDDDEAFVDDAEMYNRAKCVADIMLSNIVDVLYDREEFGSTKEYYDSLAARSEYLENHKPLKSNTEEYSNWVEEQHSIQASLFYSSLIDSLLVRSDSDDEKLQQELADGTLHISDLLEGVGNCYEDVDSILIQFNLTLKQACINTDSPDAALLAIRRLTYSLIERLDQEYEQLIKEEPPAGNMLMHTRWKDALTENRLRRTVVRMSKASLLYFIDITYNHTDGASGDLLNNLLMNPAFSPDSNGDGFPFSDDSFDSLWDDDDDDDDEWDEDYDDRWDDDFDYEDEADAFYKGDYDYWKFYFDPDGKTDDPDDDDE